MPLAQIYSLLRHSLILGLLAWAPAAGAEPGDAPPAPQAREHAHEHEHADGPGEHTEQETIVVTGTPLEHSPDDLAIPVDVYQRRQVLETLGTTLGETLVRQPGITTSGFAAGASRPVIRGQDAFRTEVLEGGLGTQDLSRLSPDHAIPINPLAAQRIEVLRGPATLRHGGGAAAGVVNVITQRVPTRLADEGMRGEVFGSYGTVASERNLSFVLDGSSGPMAWHFDGLAMNADDYRIPGNPDHQPGSDVDTGSISAGSAYIGEAGRLGVSYTRFSSDYGIPETGEAVTIDMATHRFRLEGDLETPVSWLEAVHLRSAYTDYAHDEISGGAIGQTFDNDEFEGRLEALHIPLVGFTGALGLQGTHQALSAGGAAAEFLAPTKTGSVAAYLYEERAITQALNAELGFRVEYVGVQGTPADGLRRDLSFAPVSGSVALRADLGADITVGLLGAVAQRAPSQIELYSRGPHEATGTFETGDPNLGEETSYTGEMRVTAALGEMEFEWAQFVTHYDDYIFGALTGTTVDEQGDPIDPTNPAALDELDYLSRSALFYGGELTASASLFSLLDGEVGVEASFDWVRAEFTVGPGDRNLPRIPPMRWGGGVFYVGDRLRARLDVRRTDAQDRVAGYETPTGGFTMLDLGLSYLLVDHAVGEIELSLVARNLLDQRARNHVAFDKDQVLLPGRGVRLGVRGGF